MGRVGIAIADGLPNSLLSFNFTVVTPSGTKTKFSKPSFFVSNKALWCLLCRFFFVYLVQILYSHFLWIGFWILGNLDSLKKYFLVKRADFLMEKSNWSFSASWDPWTTFVIAVFLSFPVLFCKSRRRMFFGSLMEKRGYPYLRK